MATAPRTPPPPLLLLLLLLLGGAAAHPAPPRPPRHSDGAFTSALSRLREGARLQRLLQGLVGKRSEPDAAAWTAGTRSARGHLCVPWPDWPALDAWAPRSDDGPRARPGLLCCRGSEVEVGGPGFRASSPPLRGPS